MAGGDVAELIALVAIFLGGVACGVILIVSGAIRREEKRSSLTGTPPSAATRGARVLTGAGSRNAGPPRRAK